MRRAVLALLLAACGGTTVASAIDASTDDGGTADASGADGSFDAGFEGFTTGDALLGGDSLAMAMGSCDPPCVSGEYCYSFVIRGGGRRNFGPVDASPGCHPLPAQCAPDASCACILPIVSPECHASTTDCITDDAGRPTVECISLAP